MRMIALLDADDKDFLCRQTHPNPPTSCKLHLTLLDTIKYATLWSCAEFSCGVISACLPSLTILFLTLLGQRPSNCRHQSVAFNNHRNGNKRGAPFRRQRDATNGNAYWQSLEMGTFNADSDGVTACMGANNISWLRAGLIKSQVGCQINHSAPERWRLRQTLRCGISEGGGKAIIL